MKQVWRVGGGNVLMSEDTRPSRDRHVGGLLRWVVLVCAFGAVAGAGQPESTPPTRFAVMSFNILQGGGYAANVGFYDEDFGGSRLDDIARIINSSGADIVGVQENADGDALLDALGSGWSRLGDIYSRLELEPIDAPTPLSVCRAVLSDGRRVVVVNIHWRPSPYGPFELRERMLQDDLPTDAAQLVEEILEASDKLEGSRGYQQTLDVLRPYIEDGEVVVLTGDFNEPSHLDWTERYAREGEDRWVTNPTGTPLRQAVPWRGSGLLAGLGLRDGFRTVHADEVAEPGVTWTPPYGTNTPGRRPWGDQVLDRIDWVLFAGEGLEALATEVVGEEQFSPWPSDHRAVLVEFELQGRSVAAVASDLADRLEFIGPAIEEPGYHVWGASPIEDAQGRVHLFAARWPIEARFDPGWRTASEIAHYVADRPEGPFEFVEVVLAGTDGDSWDSAGAHNPAVHRVGERFAIFYTSNNGLAGHPANQCIGLAIADSLDGPWEKVGQDGKVLAPSPDASGWTHKAGNGVNNPAFIQHPDGRFLLYFKSAGGKMGLAIAEQLEGPYEQIPKPVTDNEVAIEDGYAFVRDGRVVLVTTDNHGILERGGGLVWESDDGVSFADPSPAYHRLEHYLPGGVPEGARQHYGRQTKLERPQLLIRDGEPVYLYAPSGTNLAGGDGAANYVFRVQTDDR